MSGVFRLAISTTDGSHMSAYLLHVVAKQHNWWYI